MATDSSESANNLTLVNEPRWTGGRINGAIVLDGVDDYLRSDRNVLDPAASDFTAAAWFRLNGDSTHQAILAQEDGTSTGRVWLKVTPNTKLSSVLGGAESEATTPLTVGMWYHAALVKSGSTLKIYLNGALDGQTVRTVGSASGNIRVGANRSGGSSFNGTVDEVRIYDAALSPQQIQQLYQWP